MTERQHIAGQAHEIVTYVARRLSQFAATSCTKLLRGFASHRIGSESRHSRNRDERIRGLDLILAEKFFLILETLRSHASDERPRIVTSSIATRSPVPPSGITESEDWSLEQDAGSRRSDVAAKAVRASYLAVPRDHAPSTSASRSSSGAGSFRNSSASISSRCDSICARAACLSRLRIAATMPA